MTAPRDSKEAEKTYLSRSGGGAWEREKPFPPEGTELFTESLELLNDFVLDALDRVLAWDLPDELCPHAVTAEAGLLAGLDPELVEEIELN